MARKRSRSTAKSASLLGLVAAAVGVFLAGEATLLLTTESGQIALARVGLGDRARMTQMVGRQIRRGLEAANVPADSVRETIDERARVPVRWRVGLRPDASALQTNYAITRALESQGAAVLEGRESWHSDGTLVVTLVVGLSSHPTHEIQLLRARASGPTPPPGARLAVVVYGFTTKSEADSFFTLAAPFAVAIVPGEKVSGALFGAAHHRGREVVLHLPLEPLNYPQVNPGPGTILVTMKPAKIAEMLRRDLDQASPVSAVASHMGSLATQDMTVMSAVYRELKRADLPFVHVNPYPGAVCKSLASTLGIPYHEPDAVFDQETRGRDDQALERRWKAVLKQTRARGHGLVLVHATPLTYGWLGRALDARHLDGVEIVPIAALLARPTVL